MQYYFNSDKFVSSNKSFAYTMTQNSIPLDLLIISLLLALGIAYIIGNTKSPKVSKETLQERLTSSPQGLIKAQHYGKQAQVEGQERREA